MQKLVLIALSLLGFLAIHADELTDAINHNNLDKVITLIKLKNNTLANEPQEYKKHVLNTAQDNFTKQTLLLEGFKSGSRIKNLVLGLGGVFLGASALQYFNHLVQTGLEVRGTILDTNAPLKASDVLVTIGVYGTTGLLFGAAGLFGIQRLLKTFTNSEQKDNFAHAGTIKQSIHDAFKA